MDPRKKIDYPGERKKTSEEELRRMNRDPKYDEEIFQERNKRRSKRMISKRKIFSPWELEREGFFQEGDLANKEKGEI